MLVNTDRLTLAPLPPPMAFVSLVLTGLLESFMDMKVSFGYSRSSAVSYGVCLASFNRVIREFCRHEGLVWLLLVNFSHYHIGYLDTCMKY